LVSTVGRIVRDPKRRFAPHSKALRARDSASV
jgi:single-stranded DNA-binding protein